MGEARRIVVKPIKRADADDIIKKYHYSGKVCKGSSINLGVFLGGECLGAMQFGNSIDKRRMLPLVTGTRWNGFLEINRMALSDKLPRNSESRALSIALRMIRTRYPFIEWIVTFADGTQCGDGTIYRAAGFLLLQINKNKTMLEYNGRVVADITLNTAPRRIVAKESLDNKMVAAKYGSAAAITDGATALPGFQLKYICFLNPAARARLTVKPIPFGEIVARGAAMYRGKSMRPPNSGLVAPPPERQCKPDPAAPSPYVLTSIL